MAFFDFGLVDYVVSIQDHGPLLASVVIVPAKLSWEGQGARPKKTRLRLSKCGFCIGKQRGDRQLNGLEL